MKNKMVRFSSGEITSWVKILRQRWSSSLRMWTVQVKIEQRGRLPREVQTGIFQNIYKTV